MAVASLDELALALGGRNEEDEFQPASLLLTTDKEGCPFVCMLSSRQLAVRDPYVVALLESRSTLANLARSGCATLHVVHENASVLVRLNVASLREVGARTLSFFTVINLESEQRSTILLPITYSLDDDVRAREGLTIQEIVDHVDGSE